MDAPLPIGSNALAQLLARAIGCHSNGQLAAAEQYYRQVLDTRPDHCEALHCEALHFLGILRFQQGRHREALDLIAKALQAKPDYPEALYNQGNALAQLERYEEAIASYDRALALEPAAAEAHLNRGNALFKLKRHQEALASFDRALAVRPDYAEALDGRGSVLVELRQYREALASSERALAVNPHAAGALNNRGNALKFLKQYKEALASYDQALAIEANFVDALTNRANVLTDMKRYDEALASHDKALSIEPANIDAYRGAANLAPWLSDWDRTSRIAAALPGLIALGGASVIPLTLLGYWDDPALQRRCAENYTKELVPIVPSPMWQGAARRHDKIRVAYLSADFRRHVMAYQLAELFELHDRTHFDVIGVSFGPNDHSDIRSRIVGGFDRFLDAQSMNDHDAAKLLHDLEVDIAVDLMGHTSDSRIGILGYRPAPIQVNYLGYAGTIGASFIDYVIADPVVLPFEQQPFCTEKIVHLPDCYLVNDSKRAIADRVPPRREAGLPEQGFVFCCFNSNYKITRTMFDVWMRLLANVQGSVFWLYATNDRAKNNLRHEAKVRGIDPARLVFTAVVNAEDHLARHALADLFMDTLPYNAHSTASGALWAGLPVLTCRGKSFAGRVGASILHAVGLPELVTDNLADYETLALRLATDASLLGSIRAKLAQNRKTHPLFDTKRFCRHIEAAYARMWDISQRGEPPQSFSVERREA
jgi:protein O-GlcNAc transferase